MLICTRISNASGKPKLIISLIGHLIVYANTLCAMTKRGEQCLLFLIPTHAQQLVIIQWMDSCIPKEEEEEEEDIAHLGWETPVFSYTFKLVCLKLVFVHFSSVIYGFTRLHVVSKIFREKYSERIWVFHCKYYFSPYVDLFQEISPRIAKQLRF
jgi:hypothetical protein